MYVPRSDEICIGTETDKTISSFKQCQLCKCATRKNLIKINWFLLLQRFFNKNSFVPRHLDGFLKCCSLYVKEQTLFSATILIVFFCCSELFLKAIYCLHMCIGICKTTNQKMDHQFRKILMSPSFIYILEGFEVGHQSSRGRHRKDSKPRSQSLRILNLGL
jgi:hypothetical protein